MSSSSSNNNNKSFNVDDDGGDDGGFSQKKQQQQPKREHNVLLTKKALRLALSAPRAPPIGSAHRSLLLGQDPSKNAPYSWRRHHFRVRELHQDIHNHAHEKLEHEQAVNNNNGSRNAPHGATLLQERLRQRLHRSHHHLYHQPNEYFYYPFLKNRHRSPHPHLPNGPELGDQVTRFLGLVLPLSWQHEARDSGKARSLVDFIVTASAPLIALQKPSAVLDFINLSQRVQRVSYGPHERQYIDLLEPNYNDNEEEKQSHNNNNNNNNSNSNGNDDSTMNAGCNRRRLIFFVHGGAWGSGQAWMYRLVAKGFLQQGYAVAILSYRVYPDDGPNKSALDQVEDCRLAAQHLQHYYPHYCHNVTVMGHSSGAHVSLYWLVERAKRQMMIKPRSLHANNNNNSQMQQHQNEEPEEPLTIDSYIGIAGPYDISHHFDYEAARGVEEFSPMKPVCGYTRRNFRIHSPALNLLDFLATMTTSNNSKTDIVVEHYFPPIVLVHGVEDETVPFTATAEAARVLRSCGVLNVQELYNESVQHQEAVMQLMLGGVVLNEILDWIQRLSLPINISNSSSSNMPNRRHGCDDYETTLSSSSSSTTASSAPSVIRSKL